jgi:hypothetical protein
LICCGKLCKTIRVFLISRGATQILFSRQNTTLTSLDLSYNEIGDCGAVAVARLFEEHDDMQHRLELWNDAKRKKIELSNALREHSQQVPATSIKLFRWRCFTRHGYQLFYSRFYMDFNLFTLVFS